MGIGSELGSEVGRLSDPLTNIFKVPDESFAFSLKNTSSKVACGVILPILFLEKIIKQLVVDLVSDLINICFQEACFPLVFK